MNNFKKFFKYRKLVDYKKIIIYYNYNKLKYYINKCTRLKKNENSNNIFIDAIINININVIKIKGKKKLDSKNHSN